MNFMVNTSKTDLVPRLKNLPQKSLSPLSYIKILCVGGWILLEKSKEKVTDMRIGILTFWKTEDNYGQLLQCYATQTYLRSIGHEMAGIIIPL